MKKQRLVWIMACCILLTACSFSKKDVDTSPVSPITGIDMDSSKDDLEHETPSPKNESNEKEVKNEEPSTKDDKQPSIIEIDDKSSLEAQLNLIAIKASLWAGSEIIYDTTMFAITDLDQNGRYEVILSSFGGTGMYTFSSYYEVNESYDNLILLKTNTEEEDSELDLMVDSTLAYYDSSTGIWSYQFEDYIRISMVERYNRTSMLSLENSTIMETMLASSHDKINLEDENGEMSYEYRDGDNNVITGERYEEILTTSYSQQKPYTVTFGWIDRKSVSADDFSALLEKLEESYRKFTLNEK